MNPSYTCCGDFAMSGQRRKAGTRADSFEYSALIRGSLLLLLLLMAYRPPAHARHPVRIGYPADPPHGSSHSASASGPNEPQYMYATHSQGNIQITMTNWGQLGVGPEGGLLDPFTGDRVYCLIYPRN